MEYRSHRSGLHSHRSCGSTGLLNFRESRRACFHGSHSTSVAVAVVWLGAAFMKLTPLLSMEDSVEVEQLPWKFIDLYGSGVLTSFFCGSGVHYHKADVETNHGSRIVPTSMEYSNAFEEVHGRKKRPWLPRKLPGLPCFHQLPWKEVVWKRKFHLPWK